MQFIGGCFIRDDAIGWVNWVIKDKVYLAKRKIIFDVRKKVLKISCL